ncbi:MAG: YlxR family protein [Bacilli bacterium]
MKNVPLRKCIATNAMLPKSELLRLVKTSSGEIIYDSTGKANGHGAYLAKNKDAITLARKKHLLNKVFSCDVADSLYEELLKHL